MPLRPPDSYKIDDQPARVDLEVVWSFLSAEAYWARWRTREDVTRQVTGAWRVVGAYRQVDGGMWSASLVLSAMGSHWPTCRTSSYCRRTGGRGWGRSSLQP